LPMARCGGYYPRYSLGRCEEKMSTFKVTERERENMYFRVR